MTPRLVDNPPRVITFTPQEASAFISVKGRKFSGFKEITQLKEFLKFSEELGMMAVIFDTFADAEKLYEAILKDMAIGPKDIPPLKD